MCMYNNDNTVVIEWIKEQLDKGANYPLTLDDLYDNNGEMVQGVLDHFISWYRVHQYKERERVIRESNDFPF